jgi:hypothetical protein
MCADQWVFRRAVDIAIFLTFTDELSRYGYVYLMKHKLEMFEKFKEFQNKVEKPS